MLTRKNALTPVLFILLFLSGCVAVTAYEWSKQIPNDFYPDFTALPNGNFLLSMRKFSRDYLISEYDQEGNLVKETEVDIGDSYIQHWLNNKQAIIESRKAPSTVSLFDIELGELWSSSLLEAPNYPYSAHIDVFDNQLLAVRGDYGNEPEGSYKDSIGYYIVIYNTDGVQLWTQLFPDLRINDVRQVDNTWYVAYTDSDDVLHLNSYDENFQVIDSILLAEASGWVNFYEQGIKVYDPDERISSFYDYDGSFVHQIEDSVVVGKNGDLFQRASGNLQRKDWHGQLLWETPVSYPDGYNEYSFLMIGANGQPYIQMARRRETGYTLSGPIRTQQTYVYVFDLETGKQHTIKEPEGVSTQECWNEYKCDHSVNKAGHVYQLGTYVTDDAVFTLNIYGYPMIYLESEYTALTRYNLN